MKRENTENEKCEGIIELNENQGQQLRKLIVRKANKTIKQRYYHILPKVKEYMYEETDRMVEEDVIEPSNSDWSNPVVMIKKPNGKYRFCLDFKKINKITIKYLYPIPIMEEILNALKSAKYISEIDLRSAYHQIPLEEESRKITVFTVPGK